MKKTIISKAITASFVGLLASNVYASGIQYQNQDTVNTIPSATPSYQEQVNADFNNPGSQFTTNEQGQKVVRTEEYRAATQPLETQNPNQIYGNMDDVSRFWNVKNSEIRNIKKKYNEKMAVIKQDVAPAKCVQSTINITNQPGATLPVLRLDGKNVSSVLVTDVLGNPWSIDYTVNNEDVEVVRDQSEAEVSVFHVTLKNPYSQGNFAVKLKGNPVPITFSYVTEQNKADCFTVAKLDKIAPNVNIQTQNLTTAAIDSSLNSTLYGVAPKNSKPLKVNGASAQAWMTEDGKVVLRTKYELLSPAYESVTRSPDGTYVYKSQYLPIFTYRYNDVISTFQISK